MKLSAPSIAYRMAIARPIPLSPPVMSAFLSYSFPAALYVCHPPSSVGILSSKGSKGKSVWLPGRSRCEMGTVKPCSKRELWPVAHFSDSLAEAMLIGIQSPKDNQRGEDKTRDRRTRWSTAKQRVARFKYFINFIRERHISGPKR